MRLSRSLSKPLDVGFIRGSPGSSGGCLTIWCFLERENGGAFIVSKLASNIAMRWMYGVYLGICFMVSGGRFDQRVLSSMAEQWFQKILEVYYADFRMKREDCEIFVCIDVEVRTQQIRLKQHIDHSRQTLQHCCTAKTYAEKCVVFAG